MFPNFELFGLNISTYVLLSFIGLILGLWAFDANIKRFDIDRREIIPLAFWGITVSFIGSTLFWFIFYSKEVITSITFSNFLTAGKMYYGGEIFGILAILIYSKRNNLPILKILDSLAFLLLILHAFGRIGCFSAGCCYGIETNSFLGVLFPKLTAYVYPTQLYESSALFIGFTALWFFRKRIKIDGMIFTIYLIYYSIIRFLIEFIREDAYPIGPLAISPSQHIALILFFIAVVLLYNLLKKTNQ